MELRALSKNYVTMRRVPHHQPLSAGTNGIRGNIISVERGNDEYLGRRNDLAKISQYGLLAYDQFTLGLQDGAGR